MMYYKCIVSEEYKFAYLVVPKVACSSIKTALLPLFDMDATTHEAQEGDGAANLQVHKFFDASGYQIKSTQLSAKLEAGYRDHFKFAFVRNPWDRLVSCYSNKFADGAPGSKPFERINPDLYVGMSFAEFVEAVHQKPDEESNVHFRSQYSTICGPGGEVMADFVGRFENIGEDFAHVAERIGAPELQLPHLLRSSNRQGRSYAEFYDDRLAELVYERYAEDVELFGYSFSPDTPPKPMKPRLPSASGSATKRQTPEHGLQQRIGDLEGRLGEQRRENETLKRENLKLQRRARELELQLKAIQSSRTWRALRIIARIKARVTGKG